MMYSLLVVLLPIFLPPNVHAQIPNQFNAPLAQANDPDIPQKKCTDLTKEECRNYSRESIENYIKSTDQYKAAVGRGFNVYVNYNYFVPASDGRSFVHHFLEKPIHETGYTSDEWHFYVEGTFTTSGQILNTQFELRNQHLPPNPEMLQTEHVRLDQIKQARILKEKELQDQDQLRNEIEHQKQVRDEKEQFRQAARKQKGRIEQAERDEFLELYKKAQKELDIARKKMNSTLLFPVPLEPSVAFFIDGSGSVNETDPVSRLNFLDLGKEHLRTTLSLLLPTQKFVIAMTGAPLKAFNNGVAVYATPDNIARGRLWVKNLTSISSSSENFDDLIDNTLAQNGKLPERVIIFSDGIVDVDGGDHNDVPTRFLRTASKGKCIVDFAPLANAEYEGLKNLQYKGSTDNLQFIRQVVLNRGGTVYKAIHGLPDKQKVAQYKASLDKAIHAAKVQAAAKVLKDNEQK